MSDVLLKVEGLKCYKDKSLILDGVNFKIEEGESISLFGRCGSGKTTIALAIMGLISYSPGHIEGKIEFQGKAILNERIMDKRLYNEIRGKKIFLVMQNAKSKLNPFWKVKSQVEEVYFLNHRNKDMKDKVVEEVFERLHLKNRMTYYPHQLSGGECQRVLLAMGIISSPNLLIIDEPTVGIDPPLMEEVIKLLKEYKEKHSLLIISHDIRIISDENLADKVVVICNGQDIETGLTKDIMNSPKHPYTVRLLRINKISQNGSLPVMEEDNNPSHYGCKFYSNCESKTQECKEKKVIPLKDNSNHQVRCLL